MKASELKGRSFFKALIYGDSGVGKTCFAAAFAELGPVEYWDFDTKLSSAVSYFQREGKAGQLDNIDVYQFATGPQREIIPSVEKRLRLIDEVTAKQYPLPFKTLVIDSLTMFSYYLMEDYVTRSQTGIKRAPGQRYSMQDYGLFASHMTQILTGILSQVQANVIVIAHADMDKDEATGMIIRKPLVNGQKLSPQLPMWFEEVYVARVLPDGTRILQTQPANNYIARCQRGLAKEIPMKLSEILK